MARVSSSKPRPATKSDSTIMEVYERKPYTQDTLFKSRLRYGKKENAAKTSACHESAHVKNFKTSPLMKLASPNPTTDLNVLLWPAISMWRLIWKLFAYLETLHMGILKAASDA